MNSFLVVIKFICGRHAADYKLLSFGNLLYFSKRQKQNLIKEKQSLCVEAIIISVFLI